MDKGEIMKNKSTLLVDDQCVLCSKTMQFIINNGGEEKFDFLSIYSDEGKKLLTESGFPANYDQSIVLFENGKVYVKSGAVLRVLKRLKGAFPLLYGLKLVPRKIRDSIYDLISKHRHEVFK